MAVIISTTHTHTSNHYVVYLKLIQCYANLYKIVKNYTYALTTDEKDYKRFKNFNSGCLRKKKKMVPKYFCFITLFLAFSLSLETQYELMALYIKNVSISCNYCS